MPTPERQLGRTGAWHQPDQNTIPQVQIGQAIWQGTGLEVARYRNLAGQHITRVELVDAILIRDSNDGEGTGQ